MLRSKKKPEPVYAKVCVLGESGVGKTCFCDMVCFSLIVYPHHIPITKQANSLQFVLGRTFIYYDATSDESSRRIFDIDGTSWLFELMDLSSTIYQSEHQRPYTTFYDNVLFQAHGLVLIYDVTSKESFEKVTNHAYFHAWSCRRKEPKGDDNSILDRKALGCVLVGNKVDLLHYAQEKRQVDREMAEQWAQSQGFQHIEITIHGRKQVEKAMDLLAKDIKKLHSREKRRDAWKKEKEKKMKKEREEDLRKQRKRAVTDVVRKVLPIGSK